MTHASQPEEIADHACPCGTGNAYAVCCGPLHAGAAAPTAERLMRSRYTAFARGDAAYLLRSWDATTRPAELELDPELRWLRLVIEDTQAGGLGDTEGWVTFTAVARGSEGRLAQRERSYFTRTAGEPWRYVDGVALPV